MAFTYRDFRLPIIILSIIFLGACGGSSDSTPEPTPTPPVNSVPSVDAGTNIIADEQTLVTLNANANDIDCSIVSYAWSQLSGPDVSLDADNTASVSFTSEDLTSSIELVFQVLVTDNDNATASDTINVTINRVNQVPMAVAGDDQSIVIGSAVTVNGSASSDPDADSLSYAWSMTVPSGSAANLSDANMQEATFTPDIAGDYTLSLVVNDSEADSLASMLTVSAREALAAVDADVRGTILTFSSANAITQSDPEEVSITVSLLDDDDNVVATQTPEAVFNQTQPNELRFNSDISGSGASFVAVSVSRSGYTSFSRRLSITDITRVEAKLSEIQLETVIPSTMSSISGASVTGFNVNMLDNNDAGGISIGIPSSLMPDDTTSLMVAVETFDPNDPDDAEYFPGEYEDSSGQALVSVAFNFAEIMTQSGESLTSAMKRKRELSTRFLTSDGRKLAADNEEPVVINRNVPSSSCAILNSLGDSDSNTDGFQIPVYTYNPISGLWDLLGQGSVFDSSGLIQNEDKSDFDCTTESYVLEILVSNEIFLSNWWNLDYPLVFNEPVELCATFQVENEAQQVLANTYGFVSDKDDSFDFSSTYFVTDAQGQASIEVVQTSSVGDFTAEIYFYSLTGFGYVEQEITLSTECDNPPLQIIRVDRPQLCTVRGKSLYVDNQPAVGNLIYGIGFSETEFTYDFVNADENGDYALNLACGTEVQVLDYITVLTNQNGDTNEYTKSAQVDGSVNLDEISDDGDTVVLENFVVEYLQPQVTVVAIPVLNVLSVTSFGVQSSFPLQIELVLQNNDGSVVYDTLDVTALPTEDEESAFWFYEVSTQQIDYELVQTNTYVKVTVTDAAGNVYEQDLLQLN